MSYSAMKWARRQALPTSEKFVLFVMADYTREGDDVAFPSVGTLMADTGMSDRTVQRARKALEKRGLIVKAPRYGQSGFRLCFDVVIEGNDGKPDTVSQNPTQCHPDTVSPLPDTVSPLPDTVSPPPNHHLTTIKPDSIPPSPPSEKSRSKKSTASKAKPVQTKIDLPDWMPVEAWDGWLEMRRNELKKPAGRRAQELAVKKLATLRDQGHDPEAVLDQSTMANWQGVFPVKPDRTGSLPPNVTPFPSRMSRDEENRRASQDFLKDFVNG